MQGGAHRAKAAVGWDYEGEVGSVLFFKPVEFWTLMDKSDWQISCEKQTVSMVDQSLELRHEQANIVKIGFR